MTTLSIILSSTITALIVSVFYSKFFMKQQEKWLNNFFEEEEALIKKYCRDLSGFKKTEDDNPYKDGAYQTTKQFTDMLLGLLEKETKVNNEIKKRCLHEFGDSQLAKDILEIISKEHG